MTAATLAAYLAAHPYAHAARLAYADALAAADDPRRLEDHDEPAP